MKKIISVILAAAMILSLGACSNPEQENAGETQAETPVQDNTGKNVLVAYFSWAENATDTEGVDATASPSVIAPGNVQQYDTVFLGYPNWWYGVPMALLSFIEENNLSGKEVYLFCSHGTGGLANSVDILTEALPDTVISDNIFDCYEEDASSSEDDIREWVNGLGYSAQE